MEYPLKKYFNHGSVVSPVYIVEVWESGDDFMIQRNIFKNKVDAARVFYLATRDGLNVRYIEEFVYTEPMFTAMEV